MTRKEMKSGEADVGQKEDEEDKEGKKLITQWW
jgi:hypothetical protein